MIVTALVVILACLSFSLGFAVGASWASSTAPFKTVRPERK
jgi:hypothetical protein